MPSWTALLAIPGFVLLAMSSFAASIFLGMTCARFRDIPPIIGSMMQVAFFVSAVIWKPEMLGHWQPFLPLNPIFALMEAIRAPHHGRHRRHHGLAGGLRLDRRRGGDLAWAFFVRFRGRIAFWV